MSRPAISYHARVRAMQRLGCRNHRQAQLKLRHVYRRSQVLPHRIGYRLATGQAEPRGWRRNSEYRVYGDCFLICSGRHVITCWRLDEIELASLLTWQIVGAWLPDGAGRPDPSLAKAA